MNFNKSKVSVIFVIVRFALLLPLTLILSITSIYANRGSTIKIMLKKND
jgi:hypothetical protein